MDGLYQTYMIKALGSLRPHKNGRTLEERRTTQLRTTLSEVLEVVIIFVFVGVFASTWLDLTMFFFFPLSFFKTENALSPPFSNLLFGCFKNFWWNLTRVLKKNFGCFFKKILHNDMGTLSSDGRGCAFLNPCFFKKNSETH